MRLLRETAIMVLVIAACVFLIIAASKFAHAQDIWTPNATGGYTIQTPNGDLGWAQPDYQGGYTVMPPNGDIYHIPAPLHSYPQSRHAPMMPVPGVHGYGR